MFVDKKGLNKAFRLGLFGLYALGFGLTVGVRSAEYVKVIGDYNVPSYKNTRVSTTSYDNGKLDVSYVDNSPVIVYYEYSIDLTDIDFTRIGRTTYDLDDFTHYTFNYPALTYAPRLLSVTPVEVSAYHYAYFISLSWRINEYYYDQSFSDAYNIQTAFNNTVELNFYDFTLTGPMNVYYPIGYVGNSHLFDNNAIPLSLNAWSYYTQDIYYINPSSSTNYSSIQQVYFMLPMDANEVSDTSGKLDLRFISRVAGTTDYYTGYTAGFSAGQQDVLTHPNNFDLVSYADYLAYGTSKYNEGLEAGSNVLSMSGVMNAIFTAPISMFAQIFRSGAFVWTMPTGEVLDLGGLMTFFLTIGIALAVVRLILKVGSK